MISLARERSSRCCRGTLTGGASAARAIVSQAWASGIRGGTCGTSLPLRRRQHSGGDGGGRSTANTGNSGGKKANNQGRSSPWPRSPPRASSWTAATTRPHMAGRGRNLPRQQQPAAQTPRPRPRPQQQQQQQRPAAEHVLELQRQQRLKEEQARDAGLPVPPPATGKGGRGKLLLGQSDSYRFVLHIHELTQDRNLSGVLAALSIAERREGGVDVHGYNACISGMAKAKRWADALELLQRMRAAGVAPNTACYSNAIVACCRCGEYLHAPLLRREMALAGVPQTLRCYRLELEHFGNAGRCRSALRLLAELKEAGLTPDAKVYNGVLDAFAQSKEWARASGVLREMAEAGLELHARSYRGVVVSAANAGEWRVAWDVFMEMTSKGVEKSSRSTVIFNAVTTACGAAGRWEEALRALRLTERGGMAPTLIAYNATLGALGKAGEWEHARRVLGEMQRAYLRSCGVGGGGDGRGLGGREEDVGGSKRFGVRGPGGRPGGRSRLPRPDVYSYTSVIDACAKSGEGQLERALEVLEEMRWAGVRPSLVTFNTLILACGGGGSGGGGGRGDWRRALSFVEEMIESGVRPDVYTISVAVAACEAGGAEWDEAAAFLKGLAVAGGGGGGGGGGAGGAGPPARRLDTVLAQLAIIACGRASDWRGGLGVVKEMERRGGRPDVSVYNALIESLAARPQQQRSTRPQ